MISDLIHLLLCSFVTYSLIFNTVSAAAIEKNVLLNERQQKSLQIQSQRLHSSWFQMLPQVGTVINHSFVPEVIAECHRH